MENPPYIQEANSNNFKSLVLESSDRGAVMVCYWSARAEPGKTVERYQLSTIRLLSNYVAGEMEQLLEIVRRVRAFRDDAGRKGLVAIFNMLGKEDEMVSKYRPLLTEALQ